MNTKITGRAMIITSALTVEDIRKCEAIDENNTTLYKTENDPEFMIQFGGEGALTPHSIVFDGEDDAGHLQSTVRIPDLAGEPNKSEAIMDMYGPMFIKLKHLENQILKIREVINAEYDKCLKDIEFENTTEKEDNKEDAENV